MVAPQSPFDTVLPTPPNGSAPRDPLAAAIEALLAQVRELIEYARYYWDARTDLIRARWRRRVIQAVLMLAGLLAAAVGLMLSVMLLVRGTARGLTELLGSPWAGDLATGVLLLAIVAGGVMAVTGHVTQEHRQSMRRKYDRLRKSQQTAFGHDMNDVH